MVVRPNKPVMFAVDHFPAEVGVALERFRQAIVGKRALFVELSQPLVDQIVKYGALSPNHRIRSYQMLVDIASKAGLVIIPLDETKFVRRKAKLKKINRLKSGAAFELEGEELKNSRLDYETTAKREKLWLSKLEGAGSDAILVMAPAHAREIVKGAGIPQENIAYWRDPPESSSSRVLMDKRRADAKKFAQEVEATRLERQRRKAQARLARQKPKISARRPRA